MPAFDTNEDTYDYDPLDILVNCSLDELTAMDNMRLPLHDHLEEISFDDNNSTISSVSFDNTVSSYPSSSSNIIIDNMSVASSSSLESINVKLDAVMEKLKESIKKTQITRTELMRDQILRYLLSNECNLGTGLHHNKEEENFMKAFCFNL